MSSGTTVLRPGSPVVIRARNDDFWAYVDGWQGIHQGWQSGFAVVVCDRDDGRKTFTVPESHLDLDPTRPHAPLFPLL